MVAGLALGAPPPLRRSSSRRRRAPAAARDGNGSAATDAAPQRPLRHRAPPATPLTPAEQAQMTAQQAQAAIDKAAAEQAALDSQQQLDDIEASISVSTDRAEELKLEIEEMRGDRARQNAALIAAGQRVKLAETDIAVARAAARRPDRRRDGSPRPARWRRHQHFQRSRGPRAHLAQPAAGPDRRSVGCARLGPQRHPDLGHPAPARGDRRAGDRRPHAPHRHQGRRARRGNSAPRQLRDPRGRAAPHRDADRRAQAGRDHHHRRARRGGSRGAGARGARRDPQGPRSRR